MTATQTLKQAVEAFRKSNAFTPGDPTSFVVKLSDEISLPGKYDPAGWLDGYGVELHGNVAVVHAANGGLAVEAVRRGAKSVVAFESRNQYFKAIDAVAGFCNDTLGKTFTTKHAMPKPAISGEPLFDTIIWSEGLEQIPHPILPLRAVLELLAPGGKLYIEVIHGTHGPCPATINSWKPKPEGFEETIKALPDVKIVLTKKGRKDLRSVYIIQNTKPKPAVVPASVAAEFRKDPEGAIADAAATPAIETPTIVTPKKAKQQPKQDPPPAPPPPPAAEEIKPKKAKKPKAAPQRPPETPPQGPIATPL